MFLTLPTLLLVVVAAAVAYYAGHNLLPKWLEKDHDAVSRIVNKMDADYASLLAKKATLDAHRVSLFTKLSVAIKPAADTSVKA